MTVLKDCSFFSVIFIRPHKFVVVVLCYWSVDKMVFYLIGGVMVSILALSVLDPWDRAPVWSNQRLKLVFVASLLLKHASKNKDWPARNLNIH
jgi:hypothetical protein